MTGQSVRVMAPCGRCRNLWRPTGSDWAHMRRALLVGVLMIVGCTSVPDARPPGMGPSQRMTPTALPTAVPTPSDVPTVAPTMPPAADIAAGLREPGVLTACLSVVGAPATGLDEQGALVGYNVSFAGEISARLGLELDTREPLFDTLIDVIREHQCDISVSSQNITLARSELVDLVPYTESLQPVMVRTGNPDNINVLTDLCGKPASATEGTTHVDLVNGTGDYVRGGLNADCDAADLPSIDLRTFQTESHAVTALLDDKVAAYLGNSGFQAEFPERLEFSEATLPLARQGIATALDRPSLNAAVGATMAQMFADGTYRQILVQHLPNEESVRLVSILE